MTTQTQEQRIARRIQDATGLLYVQALEATREARAKVHPDAPDFAKQWEALALEDAKARRLRLKPIDPGTSGAYVGDTPKAELRPVPGLPMAPKFMQDAIREREQWRKTVAEQHGEAVAGMAESSVLADEQRREWAQRQPRGVEGEIQPLLKAHRQCGSRFCRKSALSGSAFCEDHSDESQPLKSTGRKT